MSASDRAAALYRRRVGRTLGAAAGGLLGVALIPAAFAFADDYTISPDPGSDLVTGIYGTGFGGADTAPPAVAGSVDTSGTFDYTDTTTGSAGTFTGDESSVTDGFGDTNAEYLVTSSSGTDAPAVGSVFDTYTYDDGEDSNIYSAVPAGDGNYTITDTLVTPYGDETIPTTLNAADVSVADAGGVTVGNGNVIEPVGTQAITQINGIPPLTVALQGTQTFDVDNAASTSVGTVGVDDTTTADGVGTYTEAVLVTADTAGTVGTAAGDVPAVGSVFNTIDLDGIDNVYSDLVGTDGAANVITDTVDTSLGDFTIPTTFNAAAAEDTAAVDLASGDVLDPTGSLALTAINGLPPVDVGVQGTQTFDLDSSTGAELGTFNADVTNTLDAFGDTTETILVTSSTDPTDLPVGSEVETVTLGTGFENIYTDLASGTTSDTLVTPLGDISVPASFDVVANALGDLLSASG